MCCAIESASHFIAENKFHSATDDLSHLVWPSGIQSLSNLKSSEAIHPLQECAS